MFKKIFGHIGNEEITKELISSIINQKIEAINLEGNTILERDLFDDKLGILDIKAIIDGGTICDIEMQVSDKKDIEKRILFYWSKLYISNIEKGENYRNLKKTISIIIAKYEIANIKEVDKFHTKWQIREETYGKTILTNVLEIHIIELPKFEKIMNNNNINENKKLISWLKFILDPNNMEVTELKENINIKKAKDELEGMTRSEYEARLAELRLKYIMDTDAVERLGIEKGIKIGIEESKKKIVKKLISKGYALKEISEIMDISIEDIKKINK